MDDFDKYLKSLKAIKITKTGNESGLYDLGTGLETQTIIPPLNTDIRFSSVLQGVSPTDKRVLSDIKDVEFPLEFSWAKITNDDSSDIISKKQEISPPGNQLNCGSCWAYSTSRVVSDNFIVSGISKKNPRLSASYCLSCYPQNGCGGGNPGLLLNDINEKGIKSDDCISYAWCRNSAKCNGEDYDPNFNMNDLLPPVCGCINNKKHLVYKIQNPRHFDIIDTAGVNGQIKAMKNQIINKGPIVGGFVVFKNFISGEHTKVNGGVYLENAIYDEGRIHFIDNFEDNIDQTYINGAHAISIVGWGVEKNVIYGNKENDIADIPYWHVRNSWGTGWGDGGYFKMAMYPYNKICSLEKETILNVNGKNYAGGGVVFFDTTQKPKPSTSKKIPDSDFYEDDVDDYKKDKLLYDLRKLNPQYIIAIIVCIIILLILIFVL